MEITTSGGHAILVDDQDADLVGNYRWFTSSSDGHRYACARVPGTGKPGKRILMHRLLMQPSRGMVVHHKNNNGLDNRRCNLEVTTSRQNLRYAHADKEVVGVHFHKRAGKWRAELRGDDGKLVSLGLHETREQAIAAANEFRKSRWTQPVQEMFS